MGLKEIPAVCCVVSFLDVIKDKVRHCSVLVLQLCTFVEFDEVGVV